MGVLRILCRVGIHSRCIHSVGKSTVAGFCSETRVSDVCRWCGEARTYTAVMIGAVPKLSKDSGNFKAYFAREMK